MFWRPAELHSSLYSSISSHRQLSLLSPYHWAPPPEPPPHTPHPPANKPPPKRQTSSATPARKKRVTHYSLTHTHTQTHTQHPSAAVVLHASLLPSSGLLNEHHNNDRTSFAPFLPTLGIGEHIIVHKTRNFLFNISITRYLYAPFSPAPYQPACRTSAAFNAALDVRIVVGSPPSNALFNTSCASSSASMTLRPPCPHWPQ
jgi:hypothetical protein